MPRATKKAVREYSYAPYPSMIMKDSYSQSLSFMQDAARQQELMLKQLYDYTLNSKRKEEYVGFESILSIQQIENKELKTDYYSDNYEDKMEE